MRLSGAAMDAGLVCRPPHRHAADGSCTIWCMNAGAESLFKGPDSTTFIGSSKKWLKGLNLFRIVDPKLLEVWQSRIHQCQGVADNW